MKKFLKKPVVICVLVFFAAIAVAAAIFFYSPSTSSAAVRASDWQYNLADIICEETGELITLPNDWRRWRGENFDALVMDASLNLNWTEKKPALSWVFRYSGAGFSNPAVVGTTLYMSGAAEGQDFAFALDTRTGNLKWQQALGEHFIQNYGDGVRGTITVDGEKLYMIRGGGQIHCLSAVDGTLIWQRNFVEEFGGRIMGPWGYSESPLIDGDLVICTPGGSGGTMVALNKNTGATVWVSEEWGDVAGYSSPIIAVVDGVRKIIQQSENGVSGVRIEDGKLLWSVNVPDYRTAVIPTPVYKDGFVFVTSGYNAGCAGIRLSNRGDTFHAEMIFNNKNMVNHHGGVVLVGDHVYGFSDASGWTSLNFRTGETAWSTGRGRRADVGKGAILAVNDRLILLEESSGTVVVIAASPDEWREYGRIELPERTNISSRNNMIWAHPVVANGKLYIRDQNLLFAFDLTH